MIKKCDHPGCTKAGTCRAPKTRDLREYWWFCREHAAEYNKNWNFYAGMSPEEIEEDWERQTFGAPLKDKAQAEQDNRDYINFLNDFITGRTTFDKTPPRKNQCQPTRLMHLQHWICQLPVHGVKYLRNIVHWPNATTPTPQRAIKPRQQKNLQKLPTHTAH